MFHLFQSKNQVYLYISFWFVYSIVYGFVFYHVINISHTLFLFQTILFTSFFSFFGVLLGNFVKYLQYENLHIFLRVINFTVLGLLFVGIITIINLVLSGLIFDTISINVYLPHLFIQFFIGLLLYFILIVCIYSANRIPPLKEEVVVSNITEHSSSNVQTIDRITVKDGTKIHLIFLSEILYIQADGDYVKIFSTKGMFLKEQTMKYLEEHLPNPPFIRTHRSYIVNIEAITHLEKHHKQPILILKNNHQLKVSQSGYKILQLALNL